MKVRNFFILMILMCVFLIPGYTQTLDEGYLKMELVDVKVNSPEMEQMVGAMKGATQEIYFSDNRQKVVVDMMSGMMKIQMFQDLDANTAENYMDMMGQKIKTVMTSEQLDKQKEDSEALLADTEIKYDKGDTKEILGYPCYKATLDLVTQGQSVKMEFYLTESIQVPQAFIQNMNYLDLPGTPLEFKMGMDVMSMTYVAREITEEVPGDFFTKPEGEYQTMTMEQLQQMGLGGQMGF